ncbi:MULTISPECIES: MFS transporter [unclassified Nocardioides]|uniref:MFS transporter n=1 Tax=unclassified Nocardioides TaxID=2615069 RepID=UPI00116D44B2|nr:MULTISPECIES: MFS transporter [unclassified Nocardioides]TQK69024.1 MFS transporter [Nocardioides sp. SLBN-35]WGY01743.1 MFS transporter [Nocardioides sp. QY071]
MTATAAAATTPAAPAQGRVVAVLAAAGLVGILSQALLIPLLGDLPARLDVSGEAASWAMTICLVAAAVATPVSGRLADIVGRKRVLVCCLAATTVGSVLCASGGHYPLLLAGRALQGASSAVIPLGISALAEIAVGVGLQRGAALISATMGIGTAGGVAFSGLIAAVADWTVVFWVAAGLGLLATAAVILVVPSPAADRASGRAGFDGVGCVLLSVGLTAALLAVTNGGRWGWAGAPTLGCAVGGLLVLVGWWRWERRTTDPLVDLDSAIEPRMALVQSASVLAGVAMFTHVLVLPILLRHPVDGRAVSVLVAGLCLVPAGMAMMLAAPLGSWLVERRGGRWALTAGLVCSSVGYAASAGSARWPAVVVLASVVIGVGIGLSFATLPFLVVRLTAPEAVGAANGLNTLMRMIGASVSSAVVGALLAAHAGSAVGYALGYGWGAVAAAIGALLAVRLPKDL